MNNSFPFFMIAVPLIFSSVVMSQQENATAKVVSGQSKLNDNWADQLCRKRKIDFGDVPIGQKKSHVFELENSTDETLIVQSISVSCGCMTAKIDNKTIQSGSKARLTVALNSEKYRGRKSSTILVRFANSDREIQFSAFVRIQNLLMEPETIDLTEAASGGSKTSELVVTRSGSSSWEINKIETSHPTITVEIKGKQMEGSRVVYTLTCKYAPGVEPIPSLQQIAIFTNDAEEKVVVAPVFVSIAKPIETSTKKITFKNSDSGGATYRLIVKTGADSKLSKLKIKPPLFGIREIMPGNKKVHVLEVSFSPDTNSGQDAEYPISAELFIEADEGKLSAMVQVVAEQRTR